MQAIKKSIFHNIYYHLPQAQQKVRKLSQPIQGFGFYCCSRPQSFLALPHSGLLVLLSCLDFLDQLISFLQPPNPHVLPPHPPSRLSMSPFESPHAAVSVSCQFNHFSHFKMTIPHFYRSSCLSLPVSSLTSPHPPQNLPPY